MLIQEVMTRNVECVEADALLKDAASRMEIFNVGSLPVCDHDQLVGILTDRDIAVRSIADGKDPRSTTVRDVMTPEIVYCFDDQGVEEAVQVMKENQIRRLPILDQDNRLIGIVSLGDLANDFGDKEVVGRALDRISRPD